MDIYQTRQALKTQSIYDLPLRVTFYARVSTDSDDQKNSLENQTKYFTEFIQANHNWTFVPGYVDEGITGASTRHRDSFNLMIEDAKAGKFDYVVTKELSRFARNTLDSIRFTRDLLSYGVCVFFQNDSINTIDDDSELRLTIMAGIAQDELRKLSSRVKFGHQQAIKNGVVLGNSRMFGYIKKDKRLYIDEDEAPMVREIFDLYATDRYSLKQIENILWERGYRNHNGKKISHTTLSNTISNPKYKGYYVGNKVKVIDIFIKKQKFLPPEEWVMYKDETGEIVPAIVSEDLWDRANAVLQRRSKDVKERQNQCTHANLLTGKLYCPHCGAYYYRKDSKYHGKSCSRWVCSGKLKNGAGSCPSFAINERDIQALLFDVFTESYKDANKYIDEFLELYKSTTTAHSARNIEKYKKTIENAEKKKEKLLQYNVDGKISDRDFLRMFQKCDDEIVESKEALEELEKQNEGMAAAEKALAEIKRQLLAAVNDIDKKGGVTPAFVNKYIKQITVTPVDEQTMKLEIQLFTGKFLEKALVRTGHTRLNVCPERITHIQRICRTALDHQVTYHLITAICV